MRRTALILIALTSAAATRPTAVWTPAQLVCPVRQAPTGLVDEVVRPMLPGAPQGADLSDEAVDKVAALATNCASQTRVGKARLDAYLQLITLQLTADGMGAQLRARGLDPALVGTVMAVGPGRSNPSYDEFGDADAAHLLAGLEAKGIDTRALPEDTWQIVGSYISAASRYYRSQRHQV